MKRVTRSGYRTRLRELLRAFPAVMISGSRQCGKTTLASMSLRGWKQLDLERRADAALVAADPDAFLAANPRKVVFDEAQMVPELFPALRSAIDKGKSNGRFVLLGSIHPRLLRSVGESLAGRVGFLELTPLGCGELGDDGDARWLWGGYPGALSRRTSDRIDWFDAYVTTFVERDLANAGLKLSPQRLRTLLHMLSHVHGNLLNASDLARSIGVSVPTIQKDIDVLEGGFLVRKLAPHFANIQKRLTKSPKVYIRDSGLLHFLGGLRKPSELTTWNGRGRSFEGLVIEELIQQISLRSKRPYFSFWRTQAGAEVDFLFDAGSGLVPVEIKLGSFDRHGLEGLRHCMQDLGRKRGYLITRAIEEETDAGNGITVLPWKTIVSGDLPKAWFR
jgi:hypothetical protein